MTRSDRFRRVKEIYIEAVDLAPEAQRKFVSEKASGDAELAREILDLLGYIDDPRVATPIIEFANDVLTPRDRLAANEPPTVIPSSIGGYRILRRIGVGGMGAVYEAEQDSPRRRVALKVLRADVVDDDLLKRFRFESETLGQLQHPSIAQVYEAQHQAGGEPFIAMEFVDGRTLDRYVSEEKPRLRDILKIMAMICDGVHHAHMRGIVHRDIKPGNIIVDASGRPKIIDFGIARSTTKAIDEATITRFGELLGTVAYMSPEQASGSTKDIDTRSDVYALGVVLHLLVVGRLPHPFENMSLGAALRTIADDPVQKPSAQGAAIDDDLETIILTALERDRDRRYQSAAAFAADIRAFLEERPIAAHPPSGWYQARMLARRHRILFAGLVATILSLAGGIVATGWQAHQKELALIGESEAKDAAVRRADEALRAKTAAETARKEADRAREESENRGEDARAVRKFLERVIGAARAEVKGRDVKVVDALDYAATRVAKDFGEKPSIEAAVRLSLGKTYQSLGRYEDAEQHLTRALELRESDPMSEEKLVAEANQALGVLMLVVGRYENAESRISEAVSIHRRLGTKRSDHFASSLVDLATSRSKRGNTIGAAEVYPEALEAMKESSGAESINMAVTLNNYGLVLRDLVRLPEAERTFREANDIFSKLGSGDTVNAVMARLNLALVLHKLRKLEESEDLYRKNIDAAAKILGPAHDVTVTIQSNFAGLLVDREKLDEAETIARRAVQGLETIGKQRHLAAHTMTVLGGILRTNRKFDESTAILRKAVQTAGESVGVDNNLTFEARRGLADTLAASGSGDEAVREFDALLADAERVFDPKLPKIGILLKDAGDRLRDLDRLAESERRLRDAVDRLSKIFGPDDPTLRSAIQSLVKTLKLAGRASEAAEFEARLAVPNSAP